MYVLFMILFFFGVADSKKEADKFSKDWLKKEEPQTSEEEDVSLHVGDHEFDNGAEDSKPAPPAPKGKFCFVLCV